MRVLGALSLSAVSALTHEHYDTFATQMVSSAEMKKACGKKINKKISWLQNPGAGMDPDSIKAFDKVLKDGYLLVACVKDSMYEHGDKFGDNKFSYKAGPISNNSIVHYNAHVAKEDREQMTHQVCFEFCRGIPDMGYFGISNGRDCYCETYFKAMASDSSECDSVCEGDNTLMCGGGKKNSIFGMHLCADTTNDLATASEAAIEVGQGLKRLALATNRAAKDGEKQAGAFQKMFGAAGDPTASALMQDAKIWGGKCQDAAADGEKAADAVAEGLKAIGKAKGKDFTNFDNAKAAEDAIKQTAAATEKGGDELEALTKFADQLGVDAPDGKRVKGSDKQYYPIMYFVDKEFEDVPQTCGGDQVAKPQMGVSQEQCAFACDALPGKCVGFGYFSDDDSICILYSKFKSVQYYTKCGPPKKGPPQKRPPFFLQKKGASIVACQAKLQSFEGLNLKPQGSGKCKICLKEATKAARCYK